MDETFAEVSFLVKDTVSTHKISLNVIASQVICVVLFLQTRNSDTHLLCQGKSFPKIPPKICVHLLIINVSSC